jgi:hypothetical protein
MPPPPPPLATAPPLLNRVPPAPPTALLLEKETLLKLTELGLPSEGIDPMKQAPPAPSPPPPPAPPFPPGPPFEIRLLKFILLMDTLPASTTNPRKGRAREDPALPSRVTGEGVGPLIVKDTPGWSIIGGRFVLEIGQVKDIPERLLSIVIVCAPDVALLTVLIAARSPFAPSMFIFVTGISPKQIEKHINELKKTQYCKEYGMSLLVIPAYLFVKN